MTSQSALSRVVAAAVSRAAAASLAIAVPPPRPPHPLRAWREAQRVVDTASKAPRPMTVAEAAAGYSRHIGRTVPYHVWKSWERYRDDRNSRIPSYEDMIGLRAFTGLPADAFYPAGEVARNPGEGGG